MTTVDRPACTVILTLHIFSSIDSSVCSGNRLLWSRLFKAAINRYRQFNAVIDIFAVWGVCERVVLVPVFSFGVYSLTTTADRRPLIYKFSTLSSIYISFFFFSMKGLCWQFSSTQWCACRLLLLPLSAIYDDCVYSDAELMLHCCCDLKIPNRQWQLKVPLLLLLLIDIRRTGNWRAKVSKLIN